MQKIPYDRDSFDIVISNLAIDHVKDIDIPIKEMLRVCKKHGNVIISTHHPEMWGNKKGKVSAEFDIGKKVIVVDSYSRPSSDFVKSFEKYGAIVETIEDINVSKNIEKKQPEIYEILKGRKLIFIIKARKT